NARPRLLTESEQDDGSLHQAVTGRCFGDKDFRGGLENGILLCELLSSIKPGLVKKINRLPTPIAGLVSPAAPVPRPPPFSYHLPPCS
uniref:Calponin-homology (CH) domain-containing protein n=1 Tax=Myripristis murdjan TaxID=586833 RepID=A0A668AJX8_9TELE